MCFSVGFFPYCLLLTFLLFTARTDLGGGGGGGWTPFFSSPFVLFLDIHILLKTPWPLAPIKPNFEGERAQKTQFFGETFPKKA